MKPTPMLSDDEFADLARRAARLPDAPQAQVQAAIDLWQARQAGSVGALARSGLRLARAVLRFDSWAQAAPALGMRALSSDTRHLLFSTLGRDIDLRIHPTAGRFSLSGQVLGPDEAGELELATDGAALTVLLDDMGAFRLDGLERGTYHLTLRMGKDEIALPPVDVGARA